MESALNRRIYNKYINFENIFLFKLWMFQVGQLQILQMIYLKTVITY